MGGTVIMVTGKPRLFAGAFVFKGSGKSKHDRFRSKRSDIPVRSLILTGKYAMFSYDCCLFFA